MYVCACVCDVCVICVCVCGLCVCLFLRLCVFVCVFVCQRDKSSIDYLSQNVTVFVPSREIWRNFSSSQENFWFHRRRVKHFLQ